MSVDLPPLEDPGYEPRHRPVDGRPAAVVARWGAASQLRWFRRFRDELAPMPAETAGRFYCQSVQHRGYCCGRCIDEEEYNGWPTYDDFCCCEGYKAARDHTEDGRVFG